MQALLLLLLHPDFRFYASLFVLSLKHCQSALAMSVRHIPSQPSCPQGFSFKSQRLTSPRMLDPEEVFAGTCWAATGTGRPVSRRADLVKGSSLRQMHGLGEFLSVGACGHSFEVSV